MDFFQLLILNKARRTGAPCINNPLGDPRSMPLDADHSPPPSEDCLHLSGPQSISPFSLMVKLPSYFSAEEYLDTIEGEACFDACHGL